MSYNATDHDGKRQTYEGIRQYRIPCTLNNSETIVIVEHGGEPDLWVVDRLGGLDELGRLYRSIFNVNFIDKPQTRFITIVKTK